MQQLDEVDLISWPDGPNGGPRLLGRTDDPEVVAYVRDRLARERRADLARLVKDGGAPAPQPLNSKNGSDPTPNGTAE